MTLFWIIFGTLFAVMLAALGVGQAWAHAARRREAVEHIKARSSGAPAQYAQSPTPQMILIPERKAGVLEQLPAMQPWMRLIEASGSDWSPLGVLIATLILGFTGAVVGSIFPLFIFPVFSSVLLAGALASLPTLILLRRRARRLNDFEEQFPEALDFVARALRAGHAFSVSLEMLAVESDEPLRSEFRRVFQEQNLGAPLDSVLRGLAERVPTMDVKFFVSAVLLQRETGGNLSEMLTKLAHTIRERFRLKGHIRAATAHGRMTAVVLTLLPIVVAASLTIRAPKYMELFVTDFHGRLLGAAAIVLQFLGYYVMYRMINFKV